jgi:hypothetical protein
VTGVKRCSIAVVLVFLVSCQQPPAYVSHFVPPTTFVDTFNRPNTELGLGNGWDTRTYVDDFPLPAATDGFIRDGTYSYAGDSVVYAARQFRGTVKRMGSVGSWKQTRGGGETTLAMAITSNDALITHMVHFAANRSVWELTVRRGGAFEPVASGRFSPTLALDHGYQFEIEAADNSVTVRVPGSEVTKNVPTDGLLGDRAFWEEYAKPMPAGVVFDFDAVWAAEEGQTLLPVATP